MHSSRSLCRHPSVYRVVRAPASRSMSLFSPSPFFGRLPQSPFQSSFNHGFNDLFRIMDEFAGSARALDHFNFPAQLRATAPTFQPRFDVREQDGVYELRGELPGVEAKDLDVQFTDAQTLVIRGRTEQETTRGSLPQSTTTQTPAVEAAKPDTTMSGALESEVADSSANAVAADNSDAASVRSSSSYQKATVEDEADEIRSIASSAPAQATPAESVAGEQPAATETTVSATATQPEQAQAQAQQPQQSQQQPESRYWVSERSVGSFQRVFQFPTRVDHDNVKASLKNGILTMTVPKQVQQGARRINVE